MDTGAIIVAIIFAVVISIISIIYSRKSKENLLATQYYDSLTLVNAKCGLIGKYLDGLPDFASNTECYILADEKQLSIMPIDNTDYRVILPLYKIKLFQNTLADDDFLDRFAYRIGITNAQFDSKYFLSISYNSKNDDSAEMVFSYNANALEKQYNNYAPINIFEFVKKHIPKQETTIEL